MPPTTRGPLPAGVYWRRRLALLSIAVVLVLAIGKVLGSGSDGSSDGKAEQVGTMTSPTATVTTDPSAGQTEAGGKGKGKGGRGGKGKNHQSATPSVTPTPTPPPLPDPTGPCADDDVFITPSVDAPVGGSDITFQLNLQTRTSDACTWTVSPDTVSMTIAKDRDVVWQSEECPDVVPTTEVVVRRASVVQVPLVWNARRSDAECSDRTAYVLPNVYHVQTSALGGEPTDVEFELVAPLAPTVTQTVVPETPGGGSTGPTATP